MFEQFTCTLSDWRTVTVDINRETYFISDAFDEYDPYWMPNGKERNEIVKLFLKNGNLTEARQTP